MTTSFESIKPQNAANDATNVLSSGLSAWRTYVLDLPMTLTAEAMRFASRRLEAQAEHLCALGRCASVTEAAKLQTDFLSRAATAYQDEAKVVSQDVENIVRPHAA
jgi:Phasin protein